MEISDSIKMGGHEIRVEYVDTAHSSNKGLYNDYHN